MGDRFYLIAETYIQDAGASKAVTKSPEMVAAGENLNTFVEEPVTMMFSQEA